MQQLLENRSPFERLASEGGRRSPQTRRLRYLIVAMAMITLFAIFAPSGRQEVPTSVLPHTLIADEGEVKTKGIRENAALDVTVFTPSQQPHTSTSVKLPEPWGYNKDRNVPRGQAILASIAKDVDQGRFGSPGASSFSLVDYGSDQGYFSISVAKIFKGATVMGVEMGGVGGEIWKKANSQDVLTIQENKIREHGAEKNMQICQAKVVPESFFELKDSRLVSDYQFVLSVFHWFDLPSRSAFDKTISTLFLNARTTFIELPIIGDNGALIRKQVGWKNFVKWYDGRTAMTQIITEAAESEGILVNVTLVASVPWVKWQRETFRVDILSVKGEEGPATNFGCKNRRSIYKCAVRTLFSSCPI